MWMVAAAVALDMILGDPLWFPHPVIFIGKLISFLEKLLYDKKSRFKGILLTVVCCAVVWAVCELTVYLAGLIRIENYVVVFFLYTSLAVKSLAKAGNDVKNAFGKGIEQARIKLSYIVGRDTKDLDGQAILRGTVETIAENTVDGVLAPLLFMALGFIFGKPLQFVFLYKTVNTLDSMVGYKNDKYMKFGWFSAKLDDALNFIPARLGSGIMMLSGLILGYDFKSGVKIFFRDRLKHKSPNSAHPESAVAGLLNIRLGGPNMYFGTLVDKSYIGDGERDLTLLDITKANRILYVSAVLSAVVFIILEVVFMKWRAHGANPEKLYRQFGIKMPEHVLDFSTNTNVVKPEAELIRDFEKLITDYPDDESIEFREKISEKLRVDCGNILITNGSNEAIYILVSMYEKIAIMQPTYCEYKRACLAYGKKAYDIFSPEELRQRTDLLIMCNPNNPTGKYIDAETVEKIAEKCALQGTDVVIDEAYMDFVHGVHEHINLSKHKNVYFLRSMTKIYRMAGIRLGYVIAGREKIKKLKRRQPTWSVNALAQAYGIHCLNDCGFLQRTSAYYKTETARLKAAVTSLGFVILPSDTHYFLMETADDEKLIRFMLKKGVVLRHTRDFPGLDGHYVRVCTRRKEENERLTEALKQYKESR